MKTRYEIIEVKSTSCGGLYVFSRVSRRVGIRDIFEQVFGPYRRVRKEPISKIKSVRLSFEKERSLMPPLILPSGGRGGRYGWRPKQTHG